MVIRRLSVGILFVLVSNIVAAQEAHEHQGKLSPYVGEPPQVILSEDEKTILDSGEPLFKKLELEKGQRGIAVFRVNADVDTVWSVIRDFKSYPEWIADISKTEIYGQQEGLLYVRFTAEGWLSGDTSWYVVHDYPKQPAEESRDWGTWILDYDYRSDIDDSVGFWRVIPVVGQTGRSDVIYSADLRLKGFFSSLFEATLIDNSLRDATQWVKIQAEALAELR